MYRCLPKKHDPSRFVLPTLIFVTLVVSAALYRDKVDFHNPEKKEIYIAFLIMYIIMLIYMLVICINNYLWGSACYRLTDEGIHIKKKLHKERIVAWHEIEDGRICYMFCSGRFNEPVPMFRFSLNKTADEKKGGINKFMRHYPKMYDYRYFVSNQKFVLAFYYDAAAEKEIRAHYPLLKTSDGFPLS